MKSSYSFENFGTDGRNGFQNVLSKTFQMIWHAYQSWKLIGDEEKNIATPPTCFRLFLIVFCTVSVMFLVFLWTIRE